MSCYIENTGCSSYSTGTASELFLSAIQLLVSTSQCLIGEDWPKDSVICDEETFDFIIVGAGTAGCIVANRLTEEKNWKVLLLEAGGVPPIESTIPALSRGLIHTKSDWSYYTTSSCNTNSAFLNSSAYWPRGKMLGGSSSINGMIYIRGVREDYQTWYDEGNIEWHPDVAEKYFQKAECLQNVELLKDPEISDTYGKYGPLIINKFNSSYENVTRGIMNSYNEIGILNVKNFNTTKLNGSGIVTCTAYNGVRESTAKAYLNKLPKRENFYLLTNAFVQKVLINNLNEAYGVRVEYSGKLWTFLAKREVILCAGTINSPQLLMLSGIGPEQDLSLNRIKCKVNQRKVGVNLQDHCLIPVPIFGNGPPQPYDTAKSTIDYILNRQGPLAQSSLENVVAFYSKDANSKKADYQMHLTIFWKNTSNIAEVFGESQFNYKNAVVEALEKQIKNHTLYLFLFHLLHPRSRGNITLKSNNPKDYPKISPNYFCVDEDLEDAAKGIMRVANNLIKTSYFQSIKAFIGKFWEPCDKYGIGTLYYWKCICTATVTTVYHPVGTCKMGPNPKTAVVDGRLRVHGVRYLRVIDASIMPQITTGNTNGPTVMIAERASDLVKEDHKKTYDRK